jgi:hypothetical protein
MRTTSLLLRARAGLAALAVLCSLNSRDSERTNSPQPDLATRFFGLPERVMLPGFIATSRPPMWSWCIEARISKSEITHLEMSRSSEETSHLNTWRPI